MIYLFIIPFFVVAWFLFGLFAWPDFHSYSNYRRMIDGSLKKRFKMFVLCFCVMGPIFVLLYAFAFLVDRARNIISQVVRSIDESN